MSAESYGKDRTDEGDHASECRNDLEETAEDRPERRPGNSDELQPNEPEDTDDEGVERRCTPPVDERAAGGLEMRRRVAVSDVHTNLTVQCCIRPAGTELYRNANWFDAETRFAGGLPRSQDTEWRVAEMAVMMQAFYWDSPKKDKQEHNWWNFVAEKVEDSGKGRFQRTVAPAGFEGLQPYFDGV